MFLKLLCILFISSCIGEYVNDEEYVDSVIDMLLNGGSSEFGQDEEVDNGEELTQSGGVWKCGKCDNIDESKLMYSEVNEVEADMMTDTSVDIQIGLSVPQMRCITVRSDSTGTVRRLAGDCSGGEAVTLSVAPAPRFTINVYGLM